MSTVETKVGTFVWHEQVSGDPVREKDSYGELFGRGTEVFGPGEIDYQMISVGGKTYGGFGKAMEGAPPAHWLGHVLVENVDETAEKARAAGGKILAEPIDMAEVGRIGIIADPQGAVLGIARRCSEGREAEGVFVGNELGTTDVDGAQRFYGEVFGWTTDR